MKEVFEFAAEITKYAGENISWFDNDEAKEMMKLIDMDFTYGSEDVFRENNYQESDYLLGYDNDHPIFT